MDDGLKKLIDEYLELREIGTIERPKQELILRCEGQDIASLGTGASQRARHKLMVHVLENFAKKAIVIERVGSDMNAMLSSTVEAPIDSHGKRVDFVTAKVKLEDD